MQRPQNSLVYSVQIIIESLGIGVPDLAARFDNRMFPDHISPPSISLPLSNTYPYLLDTMALLSFLLFKVFLFFSFSKVISVIHERPPIPPLTLHIKYCDTFNHNEGLVSSRATVPTSAITLCLIVTITSSNASFLFDILNLNIRCSGRYESPYGFNPMCPQRRC